MFVESAEKGAVEDDGLDEYSLDDIDPEADGFDTLSWRSPHWVALGWLFAGPLNPVVAVGWLARAPQGLLLGVAIAATLGVTAAMVGWRSDRLTILRVAVTLGSTILFSTLAAALLPVDGDDINYLGLALMVGVAVAVMAFSCALVIVRVLALRRVD